MEPPADAAADAGSPLPPPPGPPAGRLGPRRLRRRPDDGHVAGVCAGVAEYFNVDPLIVRIAAVVLLFSGPGGFAYVLAWIFVPEAPGPARYGVPQGPIDRRDRGTQIFGIVLLVLAGSVFWGDWWSPARDWLFPLSLMALGAWLLLRRDKDVDDELDAGSTTPAWTPGDVTAPAPAAPAEQATDRTDTTDPTEIIDAPDPVTAETSAADGGGDGSPPSPWSTPPAPGDPHGIPHLDEHDWHHRRRRRHRRRHLLGPIMSGALLIWAGLAYLTDLSLDNGLAGALLILGVGFVLGSFVGGSRGLIAPALLVAGALALTAVVDIPLRGPIGTRTWSPQRIADIEDDYEVSIGEGTLDLTAIDIDRGDDLAIDASVGFGHLIVLIPDGMAVDITTEVGAGESRVFGVEQGGLGVSTDQHHEGDGEGGTLDLYLQAGMGKIEVHRRADATPSDDGLR